MDKDVEIANDELRRISQKKRAGGANKRRQASENSPFLSMQQVLELVPVSRSSLYLMISNGEFPQQIKLGKRAAAWSKTEVQEWIDGKLGV